MSRKRIPADGRVQVVTSDMLDRDALTMRKDDDGIDVELFASEDDEGPGLPFRSDDEIAVEEEDGYGQFSDADGIYVETVGDSSTYVRVFKGIAVHRNPRRDVKVSATVTSNTYPSGGDFDTADGDTYPIELVNSNGTIEVIELPTVDGEVDVEIETVSGQVVTLPVQQAASIDSYSADKVTIRDGGTTPRVAGGFAGE